MALAVLMAMWSFRHMCGWLHRAFDGIRLGEIPAAAPDGVQPGADVPEE